MFTIYFVKYYALLLGLCS